MTGNLKLIIPPEEIHIIVNRLAKDIRAEYGAKNPVFVGVMKGALVFTADLIRAVKLPLEVDFVQMSSYGKSTTPAKEPVMTRDASLDLKDRHIIIVEAMIDRGVTISALVRYLAQKGPASVRVCTLLLRNRRSFTSLPKIDFVGTHVSDGFVVGYGLDYKEHYRHLPGLYMIDTAQ